MPTGRKIIDAAFKSFCFLVLVTSLSEVNASNFVLDNDLQDVHVFFKRRNLKFLMSSPKEKNKNNRKYSCLVMKNSTKW